MRLLKLQVSNFRNLSDKQMNFSPQINCIFGENSQGKTNLLEAIYFTIYHHSFRKNVKWNQLLSIDCSKAQILIKSLWDNNYYSGLIESSDQQWFLNNRKAKFLAVNLLVINPFDYYLFFNDSFFRRNIFDYYLAVLDKNYQFLLSKCKKGIRQRNFLLKIGESRIREIRAIDENLADYFIPIISQRKIFLEKIASLFNNYFQQIFSFDFTISISLHSNFKNDLDKESILRILDRNRSNDFQKKITTQGVHLDDYNIYLNNIDSKSYASVGQQKVIYLALIFSFIKLLQIEGKVATILIDDISGELDNSRWNNLVEFLAKSPFQFFITSANSSFQKSIFSIEKSKKFYIEDGDLKTIL